jgi:arsenic resistance protein ArsH
MDIGADFAREEADTFPALRADLLPSPDLARLEPGRRTEHPPRILLLYGSLRERSYSRLLTEEAARLLRLLGAETRIFDPRGLPLPDAEPDDHPKVRELRALAAWSEGQVWCSPERHGSMTGIMKAQIDWVPLSLGAVRPTQGKTLAVMQVSAARSRSTPSTSCACSAAGCGCSRSRTSPRWRRPSTSSIRPDA